MYTGVIQAQDIVKPPFDEGGFYLGLPQKDKVFLWDSVTSAALRALARALFYGLSRRRVHTPRPAPFGDLAAGGTLHFLLVIFDEFFKFLPARGALVL